MLVAQEKGNRALGAENKGGNMVGKTGVCWECIKKGGRWDLRIMDGRMREGNIEGKKGHVKSEGGGLISEEEMFGSEG